MRNVTHIGILWLAALLLSGCVTPLTPGDLSPEKTDLTINLSSSTEAVWETKTIAENNGEVFNRALILVTREGVILHKKDTVFTSVPGSTDPSDIINVTSAVIPFKDVEVGSYDIYAFANYDELDWQDPANPISSWNCGISQSFDADQLMKVLSDQNTPIDPYDPLLPEEQTTSKRMLLTGHATVPVGVANSIGSLNLIRPVARINIWLNNYTPYPVRLENLGFNSFNVNKSYLIGRNDDNKLPVLPNNPTFRSFSPAIPYLPYPNNAVPMNTRLNVFSTLLYEMRLPESDTCRIYAKFKLFKGDNDEPEYEMGSAAKGVTMKLIDNQTSQVSYLQAIRRNQELNVEVNVYYEQLNGEFTFILDNSWWTISHQSEYTYK